MDDRLLFLISRANHSLKQHLKREFGRSNVTATPSQMGILFALKKSDGLPMSELGRIIAIDNAAVTRHVDSMERAGFVSREPEPGDRRKNIIRITEKGLSEAEMSARVAHRVNARIKEGFNDGEIDAFKRILASFIEKFSE